MKQFGILCTKKDLKIGQKRNKFYPVQISIKSNAIIAELTSYKNYKYRL